MIDRLLATQARLRPLINGGRAAMLGIFEDSALKAEIDQLYQYYLGRPVRGCKNCYADAAIELCLIKKEKAMSRTNLFTLRRGKVLKDSLKHNVRLNLVRGNETEELCLYHLYTNPGCRQYFEVLPEESKLEEMLADYGAKFEKERNAKHSETTGVPAADKVVNDARDKAEEIIALARAEASVIIEAAKAKAAAPAAPEEAAPEEAAPAAPAAPEETAPAAPEEAAPEEAAAPTAPEETAKPRRLR